VSQENDKNENDLIQIIEHLAARIEGYSMDLHRRIDWLEGRLETIIEEIEEVIGEEL
jgi:hypothetical protein